MTARTPDTATAAAASLTAVSAAAPAAVEPMPVVSVLDRRGTVPAWSLRFTVGAVAGAQVGVLWAVGVPVGALAILGLIALSAMLVPASSAAALLGGGTALLLMVFGHGDPVRPAVLVSVVLVHLLHVSTAMSAVVPAGARIHLSALRRPALRFVAVQGAVFALALLAALLPRGATPAVVEIAALLGVTALAILAVVLLRRG